MDQILEEAEVAAVVVVVVAGMVAMEEEEEEEGTKVVIAITMHIQAVRMRQLLLRKGNQIRYLKIQEAEEVVVALMVAPTVAQTLNQDLHPTLQEALVLVSVHSHLVLHRSIQEEVLVQQACPVFLRP